MLSEARNSVEVEAMEGCSKVLPLGQNRAPAQSGLKPLQAQFLEQALIVIRWEPPFGVVIAEKLRGAATPTAA